MCVECVLNVCFKINTMSILCCDHKCGKTNCKIFSERVPIDCPQCKCSIGYVSELISSPFCNARQTPCSIIIRPTNGDFLHYYRNSCDLHIGLTDSNGFVYEFDLSGIHRGTKNWFWDQCISVSIIDNIDDMWKEYWDYTLNIATHLECFQTANNYCQYTNNCYSFVITFLRMLNLKELKPSLQSKTQFCKDFIVPRTKNAAKYIALYRKIIKESVVLYSQ